MSGEDSSTSSSMHSYASTQHSEAETTLTSIASADASSVIKPDAKNADGSGKSDVLPSIGDTPKQAATHIHADDAATDQRRFSVVGDYKHAEQPVSHQVSSNNKPAVTAHDDKDTPELGTANVDETLHHTGESDIPDLNATLPPLPLSVSDLDTTAEHAPVPASEDMISILSSLKLDITDRYYNALSAIPEPPISTEAREAARAQGPLRTLQYMQYIGQLEDRMRSLENDLTEFRSWRLTQGNADTTTATDTAAIDAESSLPGAVPPEVPPFDSNKGPNAPIIEHKSLSCKQFLQGEDLVKYVICTLPEEEEIYHHRSSVKDQSLDSDSHKSRMVSRMCIRSSFIIDFLAKCLPDAPPETKTCIFIKPFKPFCQLENEIREYATLLKARLVQLTTIDQPDDNTQPEISTENPSQGNESSKPAKHLAEMVDALPDFDVSNASAHFDLLVKVMDNDLKHQLQRHKLCRDYDPEKPPQISFSDLWHIFKPGQLVYQQKPNRQAYTVVAVQGGRRLFKQSTINLPEPSLSLSADKTTGASTAILTIQNQAYSSFDVDCAYLDTNNRDLIYTPTTISIQYFSGERSIRDLEVVPLDLAPDQEGMSTREYLLARGTKFVDLTKVSYAHRDYKGHSLAEKTLEGPLPREQIDSQVIIDFEHSLFLSSDKPTFSKVASGDYLITEIPEPIAVQGLCLICSTCSAARLNGYDDAKLDQAAGKEILNYLVSPESSAKVTEEQKIILPGHVYAYVLRNLAWYRLDVHLLKDVVKNANFDDLVLPPENRKLVESLVRSRRGTQSRMLNDVVRGKGQGIIVLLHGVPGTGKSSTAECVAESLECPLFTVTCGNIGTNAEDVEKKLQNMFWMAQAWNCVMLLDEADVFLQERNATDIKRNAVVSVFLRALEYFGGILFLTTNKVGKFDEAFVSRIHQAIEYPKLSLDATLSIWKVNLRRLAKAREEIDFDEEALLKLAEKAFYAQEDNNHGITWNGRQIRNAFQTAVALAEHATPLPDEKATQSNGRFTLETKHFKQVLHVSNSFDQYLLKTRRNRDPHFLAAQRQDRFDERPRQDRQTPRSDHYNTGRYDDDADDRESGQYGYRNTNSRYDGQYRDQVPRGYSDSGPPTQNSGNRRGGRAQPHDGQQTPTARPRGQRAFSDQLEDDD